MNRSPCAVIGTTANKIHENPNSKPVSFQPILLICTYLGKSINFLYISDLEKLSNPKHLRGGVRFIDAVPKNPSGKILRRKLKEMIKKKNSKLPPTDVQIDSQYRRTDDYPTTRSKSLYRQTNRRTHRQSDEANRTP
ncbi:Luciferin 4-monooxygenase [Eumeta japonica]|uniref:Luciferin 4-monooxygenase n=1 Tax=Eumeta variegata TaxID=151549 RepID=A0A4C1Z683_EUMVA|nr:Luciferin 4-monooxygenase [Eumeta japonica]